MTKRTWRDLASAKAGGKPTRAASTDSAALLARIRGSGNDLRKAADLVPNSRLGQLMTERETLENRLRGLSTGGQSAVDPAVAARFPVASSAERRAEETAWQRRREAQRAATASRSPSKQQDAGPALNRDDGSWLPNLNDTPLAKRLHSGLSTLSGPATRFQSGLNRGLDKTAELSRPLRQLGESVSGARKQLSDLDRQLAEKDVSEADREAIRKTLKGDTLDKVGEKLDKANDALAAPQRAAKSLERAWGSRRAQIESPMDRLSSYAKRREQRLSTETGGSGDLFERMQANRMQALQRQQEARRKEQQDQRRREKAAENRREKQREEERMAR